MARVQIPYVVQDNQGNAVDGTAYVYLRGTSTEANVYAASTGGSPLTQPLTVTDGLIVGWVREGSYDIEATAGSLTQSLSWEANIAHRRQTSIITTASLADDAHETGSIALAPSIRILRIAADVASRVRFYMTAADRDAAGEDVRPGPTPPLGDHGLIVDVQFDAAEQLRLSPQGMGSNYNSPVTDEIYYRVTNLSGGSTVCNIEFDWHALEPSA